MIPAEVIDLQGRMVEVMSDPGNIRAFNAILACRFQGTLAEHGTEVYDAWADSLLQDIHYQLGAAYSFHVSGDMTTLVQAASADLFARTDYTFGLAKSDLPTEVGFVVFDHPLLIKDDLTGTSTPIKAVSWSPSGPPDTHGDPLGFRIGADPGPVPWIGVAGWIQGSDLIGFYRDMMAVNQRKAVEAQAQINVYIKVLEHLKEHIDSAGLSPQERFALEQEVVEQTDAREFVEEEFRSVTEMVRALADVIDYIGERQLHRVPLVPIEAVVVPCTSVVFDQDLIERSRQEGNSRLGLAHMMWVFWHLCQQTLAVTEDATSRPAARRWRKMAFPKRVTVITLRRAKAEHEAEGPAGGVEWSHRWIVRGHWRMQPYGPGRTQRRPVFIHDHVKGPEDKPLIVSEKVYSLRR